MKLRSDKIRGTLANIQFRIFCLLFSYIKACKLIYRKLQLCPVSHIKRRQELRTGCRVLRRVFGLIEGGIIT
jgi:hypothetical protein